MEGGRGWSGGARASASTASRSMEGRARAQGCAFLHAEACGGADPDWLQEETEVRERGGRRWRRRWVSLDGGGGAREKPPCADFRKGRCRRGDGCKYSHAVVK